MMKKRWLVIIIAAYIVVRTFIATLSSYGFYHGWNEGFYSLIAKNYFSGSLWEQIASTGGVPFSSVPPMFSYAVFVSFKIFGISDISARVVSILSEVIAVSGLYVLAKELYNEKIAITSTLVFIFIPWNILWFGRVQTDPLMTALMTLAVALYVHAYKNNKSMLPFGITLGLAVFTKQPALAVLPIVLLWSYFQGIKKKQMVSAIVCFLAGIIPLLLWLSYYFINGNTAFVSRFIYGELAYRSEPFSDLARVVLFTAAGISPLIIAASGYHIFRKKDFKSILFIWILVYGTFVLVRTPPNHEYYSLPLMAPVAITAGAGIAEIPQKFNKKYVAALLLIAVLISMMSTTYVLLSYSGENGYTATKDVGIFLRDYIDKNPGNDYLIMVQMKYTPQIVWYSYVEFEGRNLIYSTGDELSVQYLNGIINNSGKNGVLLVSDEAAVRGEIAGYEKVYISHYNGNLMSLSKTFGFNVNQGLMVFKLR